MRTFSSSPGAYTYFRDIVLKIWQAKVVAGQGDKPGEIVAINREGIIVACGSGLLRIEMVQKPGGKKLSMADFLAGNTLQLGEYFNCNESYSCKT